MSDKLSERLEQHSLHCARCSDPASDAVYTPRGIGELARLLRQAASIVRAVEDAPEAMFASHDVGSAPVGCEWDDRIASINGKRVKLVEVV